MNRYPNPSDVLYLGRTKRKIKGAVPAADADEGGIPEPADSKKGVLGISYCKNLHTAVAFLRIVDGTKEGNGFKDGKIQPQLDFITPIGLPNTTKRCAFFKSVFYASALSFC